MEEQSTTDKIKFSWSPRRTVLIAIGIYIVSQIVAGVLVSLYPVLKRWSNTQADNWLTNSVIAQFAFVALVEAVTLWLLYLFLRRHKLSFRSLGLKWPRLKDIGYALTGFAVYFPMYIVSLAALQSLIPSLNVDQKQQLGFEVAHGQSLVLVFISLVVLPPIVEEILVRGFLYGSLKAHWPKVKAVLTTSILFAIAHLQFGSGAPLLWVAAVDTFILSLVLIYLRDKTGGLAASMLLHMLKNGIAFIVLFIFHAS